MYNRVEGINYSVLQTVHVQRLQQLCQEVQMNHSPDENPELLHMR